MNRAALLRFYDEHKRDLPWRRTRDPYATWVSEIMCQQTRVDTVIPYFHAFLEKFPTPSALAVADEDSVMSMWSGLGYYRRARLLHAGAKEVVARYGGEVPAGRDERLSLPGVGRYTAGAIGSIAFDREEAVVDGNVMRVLARWHGIDTPLGMSATDKRMWALADKLVKGERPGDLNQAVMELGATVCTPVNPRCDLCPIKRGCVAKRDKRQAELPVPKKKKKPREVDLVTVVASRKRGQEVLLVKQKGSLFGGLYATPAIESAGAQLSLTATKAHKLPAPDQKTARTLIAGFGSARVGERVGTVEHVLSHRKLRAHVFAATHARSDETSGARFVRLDGLAEIGISTLTKKILRAALGDL